MTTPDPGLCARLTEELLQMALAAPSTSGMLRYLGETLPGVGPPIYRVHVTHSTLHPLKSSEGATWREGGEVVEAGYTRPETGAPAPDIWLQSPIRHAIETRQSVLRQPLPDAAAEARWPVLADFRAEGVTDYLVMIVGFESFAIAYDVDRGDDTPPRGMAISFATRAPGGFTDGDVALLTALRPAIGVVVKMATQHQIAHNLATCYIGKEAGPRVLNGAIRRGDTETRRGVVWFSDLRDSTELASTLPRPEYIALINDFFDCTAGAVTEEGGEPMTYIGDGALAIFPIETLGEDGARAAAIRAATASAEALKRLNAARADRGARTLSCGLALHAGEMDYGNIGVPERQAWSVVGPVVNQCVRLEGLTKILGAPLLASGEFAAGLTPEWTDLGSHDLRGVSRPIQVFAAPRFT